MDTVKGKYIWIVGASSGIGAALAKELSEQGAIVAISGRRSENLDEIASTLSGTGHIAAPLDVADFQSINAARDKILKSFPRIDSTLFMAAIFSPHDGNEKDLELIHNMLNVNLGGAYNLLYTIKPQYETQKHGQYVICASVAGYRGLPHGQPYCASKAALINLGESWKLELEPKNIDIKIICPGFVKTPLTDKNDFPMPMIIEADVAAKALAKGLCQKGFEINFPKRFTTLMKIVNLLPRWLYFPLMRKATKTIIHT